MAAEALYGTSLALLTDLYQLTMAYGYWRSGMADHEAVFHLFFRKNPFGGGYAIAGGLAPVVELLESLRFTESDRAYLATLTGNDGEPLFESGFLDWLGSLENSLEVHAVEEGTVVFPHQPLLRIRGPLALAQLLETPLLNVVNFQTLIATKAARVCQAARGEPVLEFGLRRAQGIDGGLASSRAAYLGGCAGTSNVLAGKLYGIPVRGTHAHSWVMCFDDELSSFEAYAAAMPNNCIFLVDTYNTEQGVRHAVEVGRKLRERGHEMVGIRLDSGDLTALSIAARRILDEGGFPEARVVASNDLDEYRITELKQNGATISVWGVGTRLATAWDQPALGGVYKLASIREPGGGWRDRIKLSEQAIKVSNPGMQQVRRVCRDGRMVGDVIYDVRHVPERWRAVPVDGGEAHDAAMGEAEDLLVPVFEGGRRVYEVPPLAVSRARTREQLQRLPASVRVLEAPAAYPVGLEVGLHATKLRLMAAASEGT